MKTITTAVTIIAAVLSSAAVADGNKSHRRGASYEITVTNITPGQTFTPILVAAHRRSLSLFSTGAPASKALAILAEEGDTQPQTDELLHAGVPPQQIATNVGPDPTTPPPLTGPGETASIVIKAPRFHGRLSVAAMLIPTNDTFMALNAVPLPVHGKVTYFALGYDAGTEANDQSCAHIPGPRCGGEGFSNPADTDEGFVHVSNGFHDLGDLDANGFEVLSPRTYDWRNPVARITVRRVY